MDCTNPGCGKVWNIQLGLMGLPPCTEASCSLRMWASYMGGPPVQMVSPPYQPEPSHLGSLEGKRSIFAPSLQQRIGTQPGGVTEATTKIAIRGIQDGIDGMQDYKLGTQGAQTTVRWNGGQESRKTGQTSPQMHSEMEAIKFMLESGRWQLINGQILTSSYQRVASNDFTTGEMHCGWCTLFLRILDLPLGRPSDGNFNQAVNLNYPLPAPIRESAHVLARLLRTNAQAMSCLKSVFDKCLNTKPTTWVFRDFDNTLFATDGQGNPYMIAPSQVSQDMPVLAWDFLIGANKDLLDAIWKFVFDCIYKSMR